MAFSPPKIDLLPEHLIDQIKAGEVIERPGNLLKEILENAVDAKATKLEIAIKNNGLDLIALKDNGHGMRLQDLPLAFSRHATSKITRFEDLYRLHSYGFRGEALASIAAISKLQCISKIESETKGSEIRIDGGQTVFHQERSLAGVDHGTELVIQDLFHNTPVRLKFIQSANSEKQFIRKIIFAFILSHPQIEFHVKFDDDDKDIYPAARSLLERIESLVPRAKGQVLFNIRNYEDNEAQVYLIPEQFKTPVKWQNVYINERLVLDKQLHRVLSNALLASFGHDDFHYLAFFKVPTDAIDVNVHPNKTIIKCMDSSKMISLLSSTVKELNKSQSLPQRPVQAPDRNESLPLGEVSHENRELLQERHEYNMEGVFSPHKLHLEQKTSFFWIESFFIVSHLDQHSALNARKLLGLYITERLKNPSPVVPLLVSEPYSSLNVSVARIKELTRSGVEIEYLSGETLVLRGIPEWMSGFSLRECIPPLLYDSEVPELNPKDWSESTWLQMMDFFPTSRLLDEKILLNIAQLLRDKLK